jgi:hypothetical protein
LRLLLTEVREGSERAAASLEAKVKSYKMLSNTKIVKRTTTSGSGAQDDGFRHTADRTSSSTLFLGNVPNLWRPQKISEVLLARQQQLTIVAIEMAGVYRQGQSAYVEFTSSGMALDARAVLQELSAQLLQKENSGLREALLIEVQGLTSPRDSLGGGGGGMQHMGGSSGGGGGYGGGGVDAIQSHSYERPSPRPSPQQQQPPPPPQQQLQRSEEPPRKPQLVVEKVKVEDGHARFRQQIATVVGKALSKYMWEGKIKDKEDFKHLSRKITYTIMEKEQKKVGGGAPKFDPENTGKKVGKFIKDFFSRLPNHTYTRSR